MKHIILLAFFACISSVYGGQILDKNNKWVSDSEVHLYPSDKSYNGVRVDGDIKKIEAMFELKFAKAIFKNAPLGPVVDHLNKKLQNQGSDIQVSCSDDLRKTMVSIACLDDSLIYCLGLMMKSSQTYMTFDGSHVTIKKLAAIDEKNQIRQYKELKAETAK